MIKSIQLLGSLALTLVFTSIGTAQTLHDQMFDKFGEIPESMNTPLINSHIENSTELDDKFFGLLDETAVSDSKIIPLGKVSKGKNIILLYVEAEYKDDNTLRIFYTHSATLNKKTGEKTGFKKYILTGGTVNEMTYNGSFKLKEKGLLVISQNEVNTETDKETVTVKEYEFGKELEYTRTID